MLYYILVIAEPSPFDWCDEEIDPNITTLLGDGEEVNNNNNISSQVQVTKQENKTPCPSKSPQSSRKRTHSQTTLIEQHKPW